MRNSIATAWMGVWVGLIGWGGLWLGQTGWWLMKVGWIWCGFALLLIGIAVALVALRGVQLMAMLLAGKTTPRLAKRDFRNSLANFLMVTKTGLWKE